MLNSTEAATHIDQETAKTRAAIKLLNKAMAAARTAAERSRIESEIRAAKDAWWEEVKHHFTRRDSQHSLGWFATPAPGLPAPCDKVP